jgi:DNA-binding MarR family transcriptional regulator
MRASTAYYLQAFALGVPHVQILHTIGTQGPLVSKAIADYTVMNKALVSRSLTDLTGRGYTVGALDEEDARRRVWKLTPKGEAFVKMCRPIRLERQSKLLQVLSREEKEVLVGMLNRLYARSEALRVEEGVTLASRRRAKQREGAGAKSRLRARGNGRDTRGTARISA